MITEHYCVTGHTHGTIDATHSGIQNMFKDTVDIFTIEDYLQKIVKPVYNSSWILDDIYDFASWYEPHLDKPEDNKLLEAHLWQYRQDGCYVKMHSNDECWKGPYHFLRRQPLGLPQRVPPKTLKQEKRQHLQNILNTIIIPPNKRQQLEAIARDDKEYFTNNNPVRLPIFERNTDQVPRQQSSSSQPPVTNTDDHSETVPPTIEINHKDLIAVKISRNVWKLAEVVSTASTGYADVIYLEENNNTFIQSPQRKVKKIEQSQILLWKVRLTKNDHLYNPCRLQIENLMKGKEKKKGEKETTKPQKKKK